MPQIDFLGIGAQKAGTTWLWENLRQHPEIWMPPLKELHYFDRAKDYPSPSYLSSDRVSTRLVRRGQAHIDFIRRFRRACTSAILARDADAFRWYLRYFLQVPSDDWYRSLFRAGEGKVKGEITPSYAILTAADVARVRDLFPGLKVILLLRNPIDRAWSQVRYHWTKGAFDGIDKVAEIRAFLGRDVQRQRSDYLHTLETWGTAFPEEQRFVGFYDDIVAKPASLMRDLFRFLEVDDTFEPAGLGVRANVSKTRAMPPEVHAYLNEIYRPQLEELAARIGGAAVGWLTEITAPS